MEAFPRVSSSLMSRKKTKLDNQTRFDTRDINVYVCARKILTRSKARNNYYTKAKCFRIERRKRLLHSKDYYTIVCSDISSK